MYLGVMIEQDEAGMISLKFSDPHYRHPEVTEATIWTAIGGILEHYFKSAHITLNMAPDENNVYQLPLALTPGETPHV